MVKRGPQSVQLVKAYRYRRLLASKISETHAGQVARSAGMDTRRPVPGTLGAMTNSPASRAGISFHCSERISAAGGWSDWSARTRPSSAEGSPNASTVTPPTSLRTCPPMPSSLATRYTHGRKPTP